MSELHFPRHEYYMRLALREAERAVTHGDVPVGAVVVLDGESTWLEGLALMGLYVILAASVWWGPPIG